MKTTEILIILVLAGFLMFSSPAMSGDLEPGGPPSSTMKTLEEVEPRIPIHASDLPLTISRSGSYYLAENIDFEPNDVHVITVECNDVTIDLMGYTLKGPDSGTTCGVIMNGRSNVEIRNGTIRDFGYVAILENYSSGNSHRVINIRALSNGYGIYITSNGSLIKDCTAAANNGEGIYAGWGSTVTGNTCYNNGNDGINAGFGSTVTGNTCYDNGDAGITTSSVCTIVGNTARANTGYGINVSTDCLIDQNTAYNNGTNLSAGTGCVLGTNCAP